MLLKNKKYHVGVIFHESKKKDVVKWIWKVEGSNVFWATYEELNKMGEKPITYSYRLAMEDMEALTINGCVAFISIA